MPVRSARAVQDQHIERDQNNPIDKPEEFCQTPKTLKNIEEGKMRVRTWLLSLLFLAGCSGGQHATEETPPDQAPPSDLAASEIKDARPEFEEIETNDEEALPDEEELPEVWPQGVEKILATSESLYLLDKEGALFKVFALRREYYPSTLEDPIVSIWAQKGGLLFETSSGKTIAQERSRYLLPSDSSQMSRPIFDFTCRGYQTSLARTRLNYPPPLCVLAGEPVAHWCPEYADGAFASFRQQSPVDPRLSTAATPLYGRPCYIEGTIIWCDEGLEPYCEGPLNTLELPFEPIHIEAFRSPLLDLDFCALLDTGIVSCFEHAHPIWLENEENLHYSYIKTSENEDIQDITQLALGTWSGYALDASGVVWAWGSNERGALGGERRGSLKATRVEIPTDSPVVQIDAGHYWACTLHEDESIYCWGTDAAFYPGLEHLSDWNSDIFTHIYSPQKVYPVEGYPFEPVDLRFERATEVPDFDESLVFGN